MLIALAALLGALLGSFLNVCIARWPVDGSVLRPARSQCPHCGHGIRWYENLPVLSWLALRARCSACRAPISWQYPLVELTTAALWGASVWAFGPGAEALRVALFGTLLLGVAVTDLQHYLIPDGFTVPGLLFLLVAAVWSGLLGAPSLFAGPLDALYGACVGAGAIAIVGWLGEAALKKEAMGFGDVTLMAVCGAALGPDRVLLSVFLGALLGAVASLLLIAPIAWWRARAAGQPFALPQVPFGTFLAPAALGTLLWGQRLIDAYRQFVLG
jgi:leader peptidase (prepilin peptidase) / N-methyltransferase